MESFFTTSEAVQSIIKGFNLTKTLFVSSIIIGEPHTGKKTLARSLFPHAPIVSGNDQEAVVETLKECDEIIITDFEKLTNQESLELDNKRIIATANYVGNRQIIDNIFAFIYTMPLLKERPQDVLHMINIFLKEAKLNLILEDQVVNVHDIHINLQENNKTIKKSVYEHLINHSMDEHNIEQAIYNYLLKHLDGNNAYKEYLGVYEKPLIKAGLKKYGSQLQLSQVLGINRNTLRKKIHEHNID